MKKSHTAFFRRYFFISNFQIFKSLFLSVHTHGNMRHTQKAIKQRHKSVTNYGMNIQKSFIQFANISMNLAKPAGEVTTILRQSAKSPVAIGSNAE